MQRISPDNNPTVSAVPIALLVFCISFAPIDLEIRTLAPVESPANIDTRSVIRLPHAPTDATAEALAKIDSTATSAA